MATPEDLRSNAEYIRMADEIVDVPGGSNNNNYANVSLIVDLARQHRCDAVWAGWGHASENPSLPNSLDACNPPIKFIGPFGSAMHALGDKIGSTIIAQTAGVPCISWNGNNVSAEYDKVTGSLPAEAYSAATIKNADDAVRASNEIGYPVMIKASEGGGGKGIRMVSDLDYSMCPAPLAPWPMLTFHIIFIFITVLQVDSAENVRNCFRQVCGEVPGSPIFIMKLSSKSRHLEVQLIADEYGEAIALNGR